jgi:hypothetical protein
MNMGMRSFLEQGFEMSTGCLIEADGILRPQGDAERFLCRPRPIANAWALQGNPDVFLTPY